MSSSDSEPLALRRERNGQKRQRDSEDDLPDWAVNFKVPYTGGSRLERDKAVTLKYSCSSDFEDSQRPSKVNGEVPRDSRKKDEATKDEGDLEGPATQDEGPLTQDASKEERQDEQKPEIKPGFSQLPKETTVMMPDKIPRNKVLGELCHHGDNDHLLDLAGDAGAVGRMVVTGEAGEERLQIDLKGEVFNAVVLPLPGTCMVVNIQPNEAKVEAVMNEFIRFTPAEKTHHDDDGYMMDDLLASDDDDFQPEQASQPGGTEQATPVQEPKKKAQKSKSSGSKNKGSKGVTKPRSATKEKAKSGSASKAGRSSAKKK